MDSRAIHMVAIGRSYLVYCGIAVSIDSKSRAMCKGRRYVYTRFLSETKGNATFHIAPLFVRASSRSSVTPNECSHYIHCPRGVS